MQVLLDAVAECRDGPRHYEDFRRYLSGRDRLPAVDMAVLALVRVKVAVISEYIVALEDLISRQPMPGLDRIMDSLLELSTMYCNLLVAYDDADGLPQLESLT